MSEIVWRLLKFEQLGPTLLVRQGNLERREREREIENHVKTHLIVQRSEHLIR